MNSGASIRSPSLARREALLKMEENMQVSNLIPIVRYYDIASKLYETFKISAEKKQLDHAYVLGKRYAKFCTNSLPTHDYYNSRQPDLKRLKVENLRNLSDVANLLEKIVKLMNQDEIRRSTQQLISTELEFPEPPTGFAPRPESKPNSTAIRPILETPNSHLPKPETSLVHSLSLPNDTVTLRGSHGDCENFLPVPPTFPAPPSYSEINSTDLDRFENLLNLSSISSSYLNLCSVASLSTSADIVAYPTAPAFSSSPYIREMSIAPTIKQHKKKQISSPEDTPISIDELNHVCSEDFNDFISRKFIQLYDLNSYQGRIQISGKDSTNGCTVISPLVIKNHLASSGPGISDNSIEFVMDSEAPPILSEVRKKLGLQPHALIVPSDVHDYLIEKKILSQDQFVGICGGNFLDPEHRGELLSMLKGCKNTVTTNQNSKVGAALFFHEHVISILKLVFPDGTFWYDVVDSMPRTNVSKEKGPLGVSLHSTRIRCKNIEALDTTLRWYACSKFTESDKSFIDANIWDDALCDFDPRVFQAFVWSDRR